MDYEIIALIAAVLFQIVQQWGKFNKQQELLTNHLPHQIEQVRKELVDEINKLPCKNGGCIEEKQCE